MPCTQTNTTEPLCTRKQKWDDSEQRKYCVVEKKREKQWKRVLLSLCLICVLHGHKDFLHSIVGLKITVLCSRNKKPSSWLRSSCSFLGKGSKIVAEKGQHGSGLRLWKCTSKKSLRNKDTLTTSVEQNHMKTKGQRCRAQLRALSARARKKWSFVISTSKLETRLWNLAETRSRKSAHEQKSRKIFYARCAQHLFLWYSHSHHQTEMNIIFFRFW